MRMGTDIEGLSGRMGLRKGRWFESALVLLGFSHSWCQRKISEAALHHPSHLSPVHTLHSWQRQRRTDSVWRSGIPYWAKSPRFAGRSVGWTSFGPVWLVPGPDLELPIRRWAKGCINWIYSEYLHLNAGYFSLVA